MIFVRSKVLLALITLLLISGCNDPVERSSHSTLPQIEVRTERLSLAPAPVQIELSGTLQANEQTTISARVAGQVKKLPVTIGSKVEKGDLLIELSAEEIDARLRQAEVQLEQARRNLTRESKLLEVNASTREVVRNLEEQVQVSEAAFREAQTLLGYTRIKAPYTGTVTDKFVEVGDLATSGRSLLKMEDSSIVEVVIQVPEAQAHLLSHGKTMPVAVPAAGLMLEAEIGEIAPTVDPASRTIRTKLILPGSAEGLRSGQFARVSLAESRSRTLLVKHTAVRQNGQMQQVFVAEQEKARMRLIRTGTEVGERVEILSGLSAGDQVIVDPPASLRDGQPLVILDGSQQ